MDSLVFAGGTALNCSANGIIVRESPFRDVFIPPSPHDGGTAVGCALYGLVACLGQTSDFRWTNDFLGPEPDEAEIAEAVRVLPGSLAVEQPDDLVAAMVDLLDGGRVVGLHNGRSESGPRALGNRSILGDPGRPDMQDYINFEVKGREWGSGTGRRATGTGALRAARHPARPSPGTAGAAAHPRPGELACRTRSTPQR
jgi:carbamoyltransferase